MFNPSPTLPYQERESDFLNIFCLFLAKRLLDHVRLIAVARIQEYWVVNLRDRQLIIYGNPVDRDDQFEQKLPSGFISPLAFPDIKIEVNQLLI